MTGSKQIKQLFNLTHIFWILALFGCATGVHSNSLDYSLADIQKVVEESMPAEVGMTSSNGREFYSKIFKVNTEGGNPVPLVMRTMVLGDRRPYNISVDVHVVSTKEESVVSAFTNGDPYVGEESLSKRIVIKVQSELAKRRKNKNLFDDFRAF